MGIKLYNHLPQNIKNEVYFKENFSNKWVILFINPEIIYEWNLQCELLVYTVWKHVSYLINIFLN